jgi:hypothetical protein
MAGDFGSDNIRRPSCLRASCRRRWSVRKEEVCSPECHESFILEILHGGESCVVGYSGNVVSLSVGIQVRSESAEINSHVLSSISDRVNRTRSVGKSIKEHHYEVTRTKDSPRVSQTRANVTGSPTMVGIIRVQTRTVEKVTSVQSEGL